MWIKICGNTNLEDAQAALESGADALGFVFAASPRQVVEAQVRGISSGLPARTERYGIFVNEDLDAIVRIVTECGLTGVQIHRSAEERFAGNLRERLDKLGHKVTIVLVLHRKTKEEEVSAWSVRTAFSFDRELDRCLRDPAVDAVLVDASSPKAPGGTGTSFDWTEAQASFLRHARGSRLIAAGGLCPENVKQAISVLRPWGVDVVSGVEAMPGKKDHARVRAFIRAAREVAAELDQDSALLNARQS